MVKRLQRTGITLREDIQKGYIHRMGIYTEWGHTQIGDTHGRGNIHGKGNTRKRKKGHTRSGDTYGGGKIYTVRALHITEITRKKEKGHTRRKDMRRTHTQEGDIHGKGNTRNRDYTEKGEGTRGNTHGEGTHAEWGHIVRRRTYTVKGLHRTEITRKKEKGHTRRGNTRGVGTHTEK